MLDNNHKVVIFCTYHSIDTIIQSQKKYKLPEFNLVICDEAHRTASLGKSKKMIIKSRVFTRVHKNKDLMAQKRLYMTATPKVYVNKLKTEAKQNEVDLFSMDDIEIYGRNLCKPYTFATAIKDKRLTDYRVIVSYFAKEDQKKIDQFAEKFLKRYAKVSVKGKKDTKKEIIFDKEDVTNLIAIYKQICKIGDNYSDDTIPMKKLVGFTSSIASSKNIKNYFKRLIESYKESFTDQNDLPGLEVDHIDGTMSSKDRASKLEELTEGSNQAHLISNVNCLSEGVDVPSLDGVVFFEPRQSEINIIQCIGRVVRKAENKKFGYILIPIFFNPEEDAKQSLNENPEFKKVTKVINALRSMDPDFDVQIQSLNLNPDADLKKAKIFTKATRIEDDAKQTDLEIDTIDLARLERIRSSVIKYATLSNHWEDWVNDIAEKAREIERKIRKLIRNNEEAKTLFLNFQKQIRLNVHPRIKSNEVIEMINQHLITKPIFDAIFMNHPLEENVISKGLEEFIIILKQNGIDLSDPASKNFYSAIKNEASNLKDDEIKKQNLLNKIYSNFFKKAFVRQQKRFGVVYTPNEVVDFMLHSVQYLLGKELNANLEDKNVSIIDPFTGTGSFIARLIHSDLISDDKLDYKYHHELFANEIMLLPYYIASINIANAYVMRSRKNTPFPGIVLTDSFEAYENVEKTNQTKIAGFQKYEDSLKVNKERLSGQKRAEIKVIIGNPPYSGGSDPGSDNKNKSYPNLDKAVKNDYKPGKYNTYIKAIKWATLRLKNHPEGIVSFITPNGFISDKSYATMRKFLSDEQSSIYIFDCKGNQIKFRAGYKDQGGIIFDGVQSGISIIFLVKNTNINKQGQIYYYQFDQIYNQKQKIAKINEFKSIATIEKQMELSAIDQQKNWINQSNTNFFDKNYFLCLRKDETTTNNYIFNFSTLGIQTAREVWCWNFSKQDLINNVKNTIDFYNSARIEYHQYKNQHLNSKKTVKAYMATKWSDPEKIKWSNPLLEKARKNKSLTFNPDNIIEAEYKPFSKTFLYYDEDLNYARYQIPVYFQNNQKTTGINISYKNPPNAISSIVQNKIFYYACVFYGVFFPLQYTETKKQLFNNKKIVHEGITNEACNWFQYKKQSEVTRENIFYYVYGILNNPSYLKSFPNELRNNLPRIPKLKSYNAFMIHSFAGKKLVNLHLNYEEIKGDNFEYEPDKYTDFDFKISKKIKGSLEHTEGQKDWSEIHFNDKITLFNIPKEAYQYKIMNKSIIHIFCDKWMIKKDTKTGIINDPNEYAKSIGNPRYVLELLIKVINLAIETQKIIDELPKINFADINLLEKFSQ